MTAFAKRARVEHFLKSLIPHPTTSYQPATVCFVLCGIQSLFAERTVAQSCANTSFFVNTVLLVSKNKISRKTN